MNLRVAFYGGSFNPFTEGHRVCLCHAIAMYDKVIVGVGVNPDKEAFLTAEQCVRLIKASLADFVSMFKHRELIGKDFSITEQIAAERLIYCPECIDIITYSGLTIDAAIANEASVLVRGERLVGDHDAEMQLAHINRELCEIRGYELQTVTFPVSKADLTYVSSTAVKNLLKQGEYIAAKRYVSPSVHNFLCELMLKQGEYSSITSGKRTHCADLVKTYRKQKYHNFSHIAYMLNFLKIFKVMNPHKWFPKKEMQMAIFWHDVGCHEDVSAEMAKDVALKLNFGNYDLVKKLILATNHKEQIKDDKDNSFYLELIHDLDLLILGDVKNYGTYAWQVRLEYEENLVCYEEYVKGRITLLNSFLEKNRIYLTNYFYERFEVMARENMRKERDFWLSKKL